MCGLLASVVAAMASSVLPSLVALAVASLT